MQKGNKKLRSFHPGDKVNLRNYKSGLPKWSTGTILQRLGPVSYSVCSKGIVHYCHINQLQAAPSTTDDVEEEEEPT